MITEAQRRHYETAISYVASRRQKAEKSGEKSHPINRGDILLLVLLIEQELHAESPAADPRRLAAIREKLGELVGDAPEMTREEAQIFR